MSKSKHLESGFDDPTQSLPDYVKHDLKKDQSIYENVVKPMSERLAYLQEEVSYLRAKYIMHQDALCFYEETIRQLCLNPQDPKLSHLWQELEKDCGGRALRALTKKPQVRGSIDLEKWKPFSTVPVDQDVLVYDDGSMYKSHYNKDGLAWMRSRVPDGLKLPSHWMHCPRNPPSVTERR